jgi:hypothetical protein
VYKNVVICDLSYKLHIYSYNEYEYLMSTDADYARHVELECKQS